MYIMALNDDDDVESDDSVDLSPFIIQELLTKTSQYCIITSSDPNSSEDMVMFGVLSANSVAGSVDVALKLQTSMQVGYGFESKYDQSIKTAASTTSAHFVQFLSIHGNMY